MKLHSKHLAGGTESLGEYCVRAFSRDSKRSEPGFIGLYSGVPVFGSGDKKREQKSPGPGGDHGTVIT